MAAFLAVIAAFTASTVWVGRSARSIDADALLISRDAAPGIEVLSNLRAEMRTLEIYRLAEGALALVATLTGEDEVSSPLLPGFKCTVKQILGK